MEQIIEVVNILLPANQNLEMEETKKENLK